VVHALGCCVWHASVALQLFPCQSVTGHGIAQPPCLQQALFSSVLRHADLTSWLEALPCTLVWPSAVSAALPVLACCNNISFHNHTLHSRLQHASVTHTHCAQVDVFVHSALPKNNTRMCITVLQSLILHAYSNAHHMQH
jgi:hypothetical protein